MRDDRDHEQRKGGQILENISLRRKKQAEDLKRSGSGKKKNAARQPEVLRIAHTYIPNQPLPDTHAHTVPLSYIPSSP